MSKKRKRTNFENLPWDGIDPAELEGRRRMTSAEFRAMQEKKKSDRRRKAAGHHSKRCMLKEEKFDSIWERTVYLQLQAKHKRVLRQVSFYLGQGRRIRPDFLIVHEILEDGKKFVGELVDAKGFKVTDAWKAKADWLKGISGIGITLIFETPPSKDDD